MFSSKSTGKVDNKGSRGSFIMEKDFASGTIQVLTLVLKSPEVWVPQHLSRRSGKLQTLENLLIIVINQVKNILIQSLETHDQSCISLLKADCKLHRWWHFHLFIIRRYKHINTHNITERNRRIISCEIFSLRLYGTLPYWRTIYRINNKIKCNFVNIFPEIVTFQRSAMG